MASKQKTVIVTGASQGIGAGVAQSFLDRGYNVVANSRNIRKSNTFVESHRLAIVDGSIGEMAVASKVVETAVQKFGSIDALVNNAGIFFTKAFTDYRSEDFKALSSTNLEGFLYITQGAVKQMLAQKSGGSVVTITASLLSNPIVGITASVPMITKGGLESVTLSLATEYAKEKIRFNAVAPGVVDTPLHKNNPKDFLKTALADGYNLRGEGHRGSRGLSHRSAPGDGRSAARGRRCALRKMVIAMNSQPASAERRLQELGIQLTPPPTPFGAYVETVRTGNLLFLTGMLPTEGRTAKFVGRLGAELDVEAGRRAARLAALNALAVARQHLGSLDKVTRIVRLGVSVATLGDVRDHPKVADGASELLQDVFGKEKNPSRMVYGVASLPLGTPVELELIFEVANGSENS